MKNFAQMIDWQLETKIKIFRTDNGKVFHNNELQTYYSELRIVHETYVPMPRSRMESQKGELDSFKKRQGPYNVLSSK